MSVMPSGDPQTPQGSSGAGPWRALGAMLGLALLALAIYAATQGWGATPLPTGWTRQPGLSGQSVLVPPAEVQHQIEAAFETAA